MPGKPRKFEDELKDLEAIVTRIDSGELSLEDSIAAFERGIALVKSLNQKLDEVEKRVELLVRDAQGRLSSVPFKDVAESADEAAQEGSDNDDDQPPF